MLQNLSSLKRGARYLSVVPTWSGSVSSAAPACPWSVICPEGTASACGGICPAAICPVTCHAATCLGETDPGETCPSERRPVAMHPAATSRVTSPAGICRGQAGQGGWVAVALLLSHPACPGQRGRNPHGWHTHPWPSQMLKGSLTGGTCLRADVHSMPANLGGAHMRRHTKSPDFWVCLPIWQLHAQAA